MPAFSTDYRPVDSDQIHQFLCIGRGITEGIIVEIHKNLQPLCPPCPDPFRICGELILGIAARVPGSLSVPPDVHEVRSNRHVIDKGRRIGHTKTYIVSLAEIEYLRHHPAVVPELESMPDRIVLKKGEKVSSRGMFKGNEGGNC